jgi:hypothetical protein
MSACSYVQTTCDRDAPVCLRRLLQRELGDPAGGVSLDEAIRSCYREFFLEAAAGRRIPPWRLQERLRSIAAGFIRRHRRLGGHPATLRAEGPDHNHRRR